MCIVNKNEYSYNEYNRTRNQIDRGQRRTCFMQGYAFFMGKSHTLLFERSAHGRKAFFWGIVSGVPKRTYRND